MTTTDGEKTPTEPKTYMVPAENLERLQERIERLNKRAAKLGVQPIVLQMGEPIRQEKKVMVTDAFGNPERDPQTDKILYETIIKVIYPIQVQGETPKYAGWALIAALQYIEANGENEAAMFIRSVPGQILPEEYRHTDQRCDHCKAIRRRTETFVVKHDDGSLKQVGRQCIADFLGHQDPERYAQIAEWVLGASDIMIAAEDDDDLGWGGGGSRSIWLSDYLGYVCMVMREKGWLSRTKARQLNQSGEGGTATADRALHAMFAKPCKEQPRPPRPEDQDYEMAKKAIEWLRTDLAQRKTLNDYQHNLVVLCTRDVVVEKGFGVAASLVPTYQRELGIMAERKLRFEKEKNSIHFGEVGKREIFDLTVMKVIPTQSDFGAVYIHKFMDQKGNVATWFASGSAAYSLEIGKTYTIKASVKKHDEYQGVKQTVLTRCAVEGEWMCPECRQTNVPDSENKAETCACGVKKGSWVCPNCRKVNAPDAKTCECGQSPKSWSCRRCGGYNLPKEKSCTNKREGAEICGVLKNAWPCRAFDCGKWNAPKTTVCSCGTDMNGFKVQ